MCWRNWAKRDDKVYFLWVLSWNQFHRIDRTKRIIFSVPKSRFAYFLYLDIVIALILFLQLNFIQNIELLIFIWNHSLKSLVFYFEVKAPVLTTSMALSFHHLPYFMSNLIAQHDLGRKREAKKESCTVLFSISHPLPHSLSYKLSDFNHKCYHIGMSRHQDPKVCYASVGPSNLGALVSIPCELVFFVFFLCHTIVI